MQHSSAATLRRLIDRWFPWIVGLIALIFYAGRTAPGLMAFFDDSLEFQYVAPTFGIAHPTGYPLYTILAGLWTHLLPFGTWAGRVNLLSAVAAAVTVGLVAHLGRTLVTDRAGTPNLWAGVAAAAAFGLGPVWVGQATLAEVYALHNALVAGVLAAALGLNRTLDHSQPTPRTDRRMTLLALLVGLGLAHHRTIVLTALPVLVYLIWSAPTLLRPRRVWWRWAGALLTPLLLYLYLPLRAAAGVRDLMGGYEPTWTGFWAHVLARDYTAFFAENELTAHLGPIDWLLLGRDQMGWLGLGLAALGLVWLVDRRGRPARAWVLVLLVLLANLIFTLNYRVPDPEVFLLPALLALGLFAGGGVGLAARLLPHLGLATLIQAALVALLVWLPLGRAPIPDRGDIWRYHDRARRMAQAAFPLGSVVLGIQGEVTALRYMQAAEGLAQAATPQAADDVDQRRAALATLVEAGTPVYLTRDLEGTATAYSFSGDAELIRVWPRGKADLPPLPTPPPAGFPVVLGDGALQIANIQIKPLSGLGVPAVELTLDWEVIAPPTQVLKLSLRLHDAVGRPLAWEDGRPAVEDRYPIAQVARTLDWPVGTTVRDVHTLYLPPAAQALRDQGQPRQLLIIVYDQDTVAEVGRIEIIF